MKMLWAEEFQREPEIISERARWLVVAALAVATLACGVAAGLAA